MESQQQVQNPHAKQYDTKMFHVVKGFCKEIMK